MYLRPSVTFTTKPLSDLTDRSYCYDQSDHNEHYSRPPRYITPQDLQYIRQYNQPDKSADRYNYLTHQSTFSRMDNVIIAHIAYHYNTCILRVWIFLLGFATQHSN